VDALVTTEDIRFFSHNGIDGRSLIRVLIKSIILQKRNSGGGSTITQQLAKNLYGRPDHGLFSLPAHKIRESILARRLESVYSKQDILLLYFNSVPFGEDVFGIEAAANRFFNKPVSELKVEESALLVGMLKGNTIYNPRLHPDRALDRRNLIIGLMARNEIISIEEADSLKELALSLDYSNLKLEGPAQYFLYQVEKECERILNETESVTGISNDLKKDGLRVFTTLDNRLQVIASRSAMRQLARMQKLLDREPGLAAKRSQTFVNGSTWDDEIKEKREIWTWEGVVVDSLTQMDSVWHYQKMLQAGILAMDPKNGKVRAWVGGNHFRYLPYDLVTSVHPSASAFKPILYATALEAGEETCLYLNNEEHTFSEYDDWTPRNYDGSTGGEAAMWYALAHSLNLPAVDLYFRLGLDKIERSCMRMHLPPLPDKAPSISLGTLEMSLYQMIQVYASFANGGFLVQPQLVEKILDGNGEVIYEVPQTESERVWDRETTEVITSMLQLAINEGTGAPLRSRYAVHSDFAGKTGTSQNYQDAWFVGYTTDLVCGTWVGTRDPSIHFTNGAFGSGSSLALPIIAGLVQGAESHKYLRNEYLNPFPESSFKLDTLPCPGLRKGPTIRSLWEDIFGPGKRTQGDTLGSEKGRALKELFRNIFRKRKRNDDGGEISPDTEPL
jgi:penicillin-binding protein 1A